MSQGTEKVDKSPTLYDTIVIGAGPAGLTATLYLVRAGLNVALIEQGAAGGQVLSTAEIENYPGFPKGIKGYEMADLFDAHLQPYMFRRVISPVENITFNQDNHHIVHTKKSDLHAKTIIIATGASYKHLNHPDEIAFQGKGVSYCAVCDGNFYKNKNVAVIGGGNSALEEALYLSRIVKHIYIVHRRNEFRATKIYLDKLKKLENVEFVTPSVLYSIQGTNNIQSVTVEFVDSMKKRTLDVEGLFVFVGTKPSNQFIPSQIHSSEAGFILTDCEMLTNISGVFAAGDIRHKHCRQVTTAVGDGATAATSAINYLEQLNA